MPVDNRGDEPSLDPEPEDIFDAPGAPESTPTGPEASSAAPPVLGATSDGSISDEEAKPEVRVAKAFPEEMQEPFLGLCLVGKLSDSFVWMGHQIAIRTLIDDEILEIGLLTKPFTGTLSEAKAYQTACVAACLVSVDGTPLPIPLTNVTADELLMARFMWVRRNYHPMVIDAIYERFLLLDDEAQNVVDAMGEASGQTGR